MRCSWGYPCWALVMVCLRRPVLKVRAANRMVVKGHMLPSTALPQADESYCTPPLLRVLAG